MYYIKSYLYIKYMISLILIWFCVYVRSIFLRFSCGYAYYAISYSVDQLSGDLYLNMFLLSVIDIPALMSIWYLSNR